jgi:hypothetical protein
MPSTHIVRTSLAATAVAVGLFAAAPAQARWGVQVGFGAALVVPPLAVSVGNVPPVAPYYAPYAAGCNVNRYYAPGYVPYYAPGDARYYAGYAMAAPVVVAPPVSYVRVWVPGRWPHWEMRRAARFNRWRR